MMRKRSKITLIILSLLLSVLVLYILGVGPAARMLSYGHVEGDTFYSLYGPLLDLIKESPDWLKEVYNQYTDFWVRL